MIVHAVDWDVASALCGRRLRRFVAHEFCVVAFNTFEGQECVVQFPTCVPCLRALGRRWFPIRVPRILREAYGS